ncbi:dTDP-4-dehydrorhamnose 3,5-epimerase family protein [Saccharopolyspora gloriosae]|uniref:dTDP-4-dehydrorhamnose 3,5-epimerase family protein n=1 Tax=Saccharopolyspora gloriosae TaxID=455344 RepID=UPI001FB70EA4|nr:dTDP-4-dehydrorhamnose 3,5-epimerase family protein [Saccharopolyspora gloriosae]
MEIQEVALPGVFRIRPDRLSDERGCFYEGFRADLLAESTGAEFRVAQINYSVSKRNTLRGLHGVLIPPGQAKYVTCARGVLQDVVVDLRVDSPTFGQHVSTILDATEGTAIHVPEGFGHGFLALRDDSCICYVLSSAHVPGTQFEVDPLDPELALPWELSGPPLMSAKDAAAPTLLAARAAGILPRWADEHTDPQAETTPAR